MKTVIETKLKVHKSQIEGNYDVNIDLEETVTFKRYFKKIEDVVYEFYKIGNEEWKARETPLKEVPYVFI